MTHTCCPGCRLRLTRATASDSMACPHCGELLSTASAASVMGYQLWQDDTRPARLPALAEAVAVAIAPPRHGDRA